MPVREMISKHIGRKGLNTDSVGKTLNVVVSIFD